MADDTATVSQDQITPQNEKQTIFKAPNAGEGLATHEQIMHVDESQGVLGERHIILPVDDTEDSEEAIHWAIDNLYRQGDIFHLLHVIPEPQMVHVWAGVYVPPDEEAELLEIETTKIFVRHRFAKMLLSAKIPFQLHIIVGPTDSLSIAEVICKKVGALDAKCVVMARHSKGKLKEIFLGSVTKEVSKRILECPVVVVTSKEKMF